VKNEPYGGFDLVIFFASTLALAVLAVWNHKSRILVVRRGDSGDYDSTPRAVLYVADLGLVRLGPFSAILLCPYELLYAILAASDALRRLRYMYFPRGFRAMRDGVGRVNIIGQQMKNRDPQIVTSMYSPKLTSSFDL
jgi:hypothetical protein